MSLLLAQGLLAHLTRPVALGQGLLSLLRKLRKSEGEVGPCALPYDNYTPTPSLQHLAYAGAGSYTSAWVGQCWQDHNTEEVVR